MTNLTAADKENMFRFLIGIAGEFLNEHGWSVWPEPKCLMFESIRREGRAYFVDNVDLMRLMFSELHYRIHGRHYYQLRRAMSGYVNLADIAAAPDEAYFASGRAWAYLFCYMQRQGGIGSCQERKN